MLSKLQLDPAQCPAEVVGTYVVVGLVVAIRDAAFHICTVQCIMLSMYVFV